MKVKKKPRRTLKKETPKRAANKPKVAIIMGSDSDFPVMEAAVHALKELGVLSEVSVVSAHRTPHEMISFAKEARERGIKVIIAGAGGAAHLPGMVASLTELPVIGVPVPVGVLQGNDALLSIVQMPKGVPVATVAIGNSWNAGILAAQILGIEDAALLNRVREYKEKLRSDVLVRGKELGKKLSPRRKTPGRERRGS